MSSANQNTRARILDATLDLLAAEDGGAVRMSDIAKKSGVSRQAVYLHFANRAELLIEATKHLDQMKGSDERLAASRQAETGIERLEAFISAWGSYIPEIYGVAKALLAMQDSDSEVAEAWAKRMEDMREGCEAAMRDLSRDGTLAPGLTADMATDLLWTMLSVRNWELLTKQRGWSQDQYMTAMQHMARSQFVASP